MEKRGIATRQCRHRQSGFSLLETVTVLAILMVVASISFMSLQPALRAQRVTNAYNTTLSALRLAHDNAVAQRTSYGVTFTPSSTSSNSITVAPTLATFQGAQGPVTYTLPNDVAFTTVAGMPSNAPDGFGSGTAAVDFGYGTGTTGQQTLYFCPDGSAQDAAGGAGNCGAGGLTGNLSSGVVYIARPGEPSGSRAVTVWGATGRIRGWRLYADASGAYTWQRQ